MNEYNTNFNNEPLEAYAAVSSCETDSQYSDWRSDAYHTHTTTTYSGDEDSEDYEEVNTQFVEENMVKPCCELCKQHINYTAEAIIVEKAPLEFTSCSEKVVKSNTTQNHQSEYRFREWHYATAEVQFNCEGEAYNVCFDSGCSVTLVNWEFLNQVALTAQI